MEEIKKAVSETAGTATNIPFAAEQQDTSKPYDGENPGTIQELKQWYADHRLPDENITRFFIGKNLTVPWVFGIYQDEVTGKFVVYKNKNDGTTVRCREPRLPYRVSVANGLRYLNAVYGRTATARNNRSCGD